MDNLDEAIQTCEEALSVIEETDIPGLADERHQFMKRRLRLDESAEATKTLYQLGLKHIIQNDPLEAMQVLAEVWDRHEQFTMDDDIHPVVLAAGVGFAAHTVLFLLKPSSCCASSSSGRISTTLGGWHRMLDTVSANN